MKSSPLSRPRKTLIILLVLLAEYTVFGFLILPLLVRHFAERALQQHLSEFAEIEQVRINPFLFRIQLVDLSLPDPEGQAWIAADRLTLDLSSASLWRWYPVVDELSLEKPFFRTVRQPASTESSNAKGWREAIGALEQHAIPKFEIHRLSVVAGHIEYEDPTRSEAFELLVEPLDFTVLDFSSVDAEEDRFSFAATTPSGTSVEIEGSLQVEERVLLLEIQLSEVQLDELSPYYTDFTNFAVNRAVFGVDMDVRVDFRDLDNFLAFTNSNAELKEVLFERLDDDNRIISLERMSVSGLEARFPDPTVQIDSLRFENGATRVARDGDGQLNLVSMFNLQSGEEPEPAESVPMDDSGEAGLKWSIGTMEIEGYSIQWEDRYGSIEADTEMLVEAFVIEGLSDDLSARIPVRASYRIAEEGTFNVEGLAALDGSWLDLKLAIDAMPLAVSGPYLRQALGAGLESGSLDMKGQMTGGPEEGYAYKGLFRINDCRLDAPAPGVSGLGFGQFELDGNWQIALPAAIQYRGDLRLLTLEVGLAGGGEPMQAQLERFEWDAELGFEKDADLTIAGDGELASMSLQTVDSPRIDLALERLQFSELDFKGMPGDLSLGAVALSGFKGEFVRLASNGEPVATEAEVVEAAEPSKDAGVEGGDTFAWALSELSLADSQVRFEDRTLDPAPVIELSEIALELANLSSAPSAVASLDLKSKVNKSPFTIKGTLSPSDLKQATSLKLDLLGLALPPFSPYSGAAVGRKIENGTFNLDGTWTVEGSKLKAKNQLRLDGFKFGERVPDPAVSLPLDLALTLLRRPDGSISLSLPLSGDLSDPKASVASIVISAFTNIIMKATTAPFGLITSMMGSEQDISKVEFESSLAALSADSISALNMLAQALEDRPSLKIRLASEYSEDDIRSLKQAALRDELTRGKELEAKAYHKRLGKAYRRMLKEQGTGEEAMPMETESDFAKVEAVMIEATPLAEDALVILSAAREDAVVGFLSEVKGVDPSRVILSEQVSGAAGEMSAVRFELK